MEKQQLYELYPLPDDNWQRQGEALQLDPYDRHALLRFGEFQLRYKSTEGTHGLIIVNGPPGTGKSDAIRWAADALIRKFATRGNAIEINVAGLMDEHLGRSQKNVADLVDAIAFSARKYPTPVLLHDAEAVFTSRKHSMTSNEPSDVAKTTTVLFHGMDKHMRFNPNVILYATLNIEGVVDEAILSRCDVAISFELPNLQARTAILARKVKGFAGERVLKELAVATDGKSGRDLNKINLHAFIHGTAETLEDLSVADYLHADGIKSNSELHKDKSCLILLPNGSPASSLMMTRFVSQAESSNQQPNYSNSQNGTN